MNRFLAEVDTRFHVEHPETDDLNTDAVYDLLEDLHRKLARQVISLVPESREREFAVWSLTQSHAWSAAALSRP